ncbi:MAG: mercuric reductase [Planctomycetota bacterium]
MSLATLSPPDVHNKRLEDNVRPPEWVNPTPIDRYNMVVIGGGTAGLVTAAASAGLGAKVALIERSLLGGDCLNVGCVPSKALISAGRAAAAVRDAGDFGVRAAGDPRVDFAGVMERMRRLRADISPNDSARRFRDLGVDVFVGDGTFVDGQTVEVGGQRLNFAKATIATGARAAAPPIPGLEEAGYLTNETLFSLTELPRRLAVIGAGPIGAEMAQSFARFGSEVTLLELGPHVLSREDADAAAVVQASLVKDGIDVRVNSGVTSVGTAGGAKTVTFETEGQSHTIEVDAILVAIGRAPNVDGLGLENAGVEYDRRTGVTVDDSLRTTNKRIFAAGDIASKYKFTHAADFLARTVIRNALFMGRGKASALTIPWATYTAPELAHVGLTEAEAAERGVPVDVFRQDLEHVDRAILDGDNAGFVKALVEKGTDKIVGATVVAEHAGDMISQFSLAMTHGLGLKKFASTIYPYPTQAEAIRKLGDQFNKTKLTPFTAKLLRFMIRLTSS